MPCGDNRDVDALRDEMERSKQLTQLLCGLCEKLGDTWIKHHASAEMVSWWEQHQEKDRLRLAQEEERQQLIETKEAALAKLTAQEKKALGVGE